MTVYRLTKAKYSNDLSGMGARLAGGRWNSKGVPMIYTSGSRALCLVELAVHIPYGIIPKNYVLLSIEIPDDIKVKELNKSDLAPNWNEFPHGEQTKKVGDSFISENKFCVMKVPSSVVRDEWNFLINPRHSLMQQIEIKDTEPFEIDNRLFS